MQLSHRSSKRSAPRRALLSNNSAYILLGVVALVGALLYGIGTWLVRRERALVIPIEPSQTDKNVETVSDDVFALDMDQIERLALVGQPWCVEQLERDFLHDKDERVRNAAEDAIIVIRARG